MSVSAPHHNHFCVWVDHREAKIYGIGLESADEQVLVEPGPHRHIHRKADQVHQGKEPPDEGFLHTIATALGDAQGILIVGPGTAKRELAGYLNLQFPAIARRVWRVEAMDHPTDRQIVAEAREFFHGAERMR